MLLEKTQKDSRDIVFVYTSCSSIEEARSIGLSAINEKLAISADYWLTNSIYPWKNVVQEIEQYIIMFATQRELGDKLIKHIEAEHSYDVPMIIKTNTDMVNQDYFFWVDTTLSNKGKYITEEEKKKMKKKDDEFHFEKLK